MGGHPADLDRLCEIAEKHSLALIEDSIDWMDQILEQEAPLDDPLERCRAVITVSSHHMVENKVVFRPMLIAAHQGLTRDSFEDGQISMRASRMQAVAIESIWWM